MTTAITNKAHLISRKYAKYVKRFGYDPYMVAPFNDPKIIAETMDCLLVIGGADISPILYGQDVTSEGSVGCRLDRDQFEFNLLMQFYKQSKPIFGICRGMQLMGLFLDQVTSSTFFRDRFTQEIAEVDGVINLHQQYEAEIPGDNPVHRVKWHGKLVHKSMDECYVNSYHHQGYVIESGCLEGISSIGISGFSFSKEEDGIFILEGFVHGNGLIAAVQHHPEKTQNDPFDHLFKQTMEMSVKSKNAKG